MREKGTCYAFLVQFVSHVLAKIVMIIKKEHDDHCGNHGQSYYDADDISNLNDQVPSVILKRLGRWQ